METMYFVYGSELRPQPLDPGTALYARVYEGQYLYSDYRWDPDTNTWVTTEYLGYLMVTGDPNLDNVAVADLPAVVTKF